MESLNHLKSHLRCAAITSTLMYAIVYFLFEYKTPFADLFIVLLGAFAAVTISSLIVCTCISKRMENQIKISNHNLD